ncbi:quinone oxidoreductase 2 [Apiospora phragmitis]|uniref:Quinone oxidoreductase 2 n=1 Tax=Apiospora phragmitis TaxID=2905665 RepID=A0ABR1VFM9_9PEZI
MPKYVLTGADGKLGSAAAAFAAEIAKPEDKLVFTAYKLSNIPKESLEAWQAKGIEVAGASYDDTASLLAVFQGADAVSMVSTWAFGDRPKQAARVIEAAQQCGVRRLCYTSFVGAGLEVEKEEDLPFLPRDHARIEKLIKASGLEYNIQRNYLYQDNIAELFVPSWPFCGDSWLNNTHHVRAAYVARDDCGRVLAALLLGRGQPNKVYHVTGPEAVTDGQIMDWICDQTGYQCEFIDMPDAELRRWWADRGLPEDAATGDFSGLPMKLCMEDLLCCGEMVARGYMLETSDVVERLTGRRPLRFRETLMKYKANFPVAADTSDCDHVANHCRE